MPSPSTVSTGASTTRRAANDFEKQGAWAETTPTIFVCGEKALRAAAAAHTPEPWPMGT